MKTENKHFTYNGNKSAALSEGGPASGEPTLVLQVERQVSIASYELVKYLAVRTRLVRHRAL